MGKKRQSHRRSSTSGAPGHSVRETSYSSSSLSLSPASFNVGIDTLSLIAVTAALLLTPLIFQIGYDPFRLPKVIFHLGVNGILFGFVMAKWLECRPTSPLSSPLGPPILAGFLLLGCWSIGLALRDEARWTDQTDGLIALSFLVFFHATRQLTSRKTFIQVMLGAVSISAVLSSMIAIGQYFDIDLVSPILARFGINVPFSAGKAHFVRNWVTVGLVGQPTLLAGYLGAALPLIFGWGMSFRRSWSVSLAVFASLVVTAAAFLTHTRGVIIALPIASFATLLVCGIAVPQWRRISIGLGSSVLVGSAGTVAAFLYAVPTFRQKVLDLFTYASSGSYRLFFWDVASDMGLDSPIVGKGPGAFRREAIDWRGEILEAGTRLPIDEATPVQAHSEPLQLFAEFGFAGVLIGVWLLAVVCHLFWRSLRAKEAPFFEKIMAAAAFAGLLTVLISSWVSFPFQIMPSLSLSVFCIAMLSGIASNQTQTPQHPPLLPILPIRRVLQVVLIAGGFTFLQPLAKAWQANHFAYEAQKAGQRGELSARIGLWEAASRQAPWVAEFRWEYASALLTLESVRTHLRGEEEIWLTNAYLLSMNLDALSDISQQLLLPPETPAQISIIAQEVSAAASKLGVRQFRLFDARLDAFTGNYESAIEKLEPLLILTTHNEEEHEQFQNQFKRIVFAQMVAHLQQQDLAAAKRDAERVLRAMPDDVETLSILGLLKFREGDFSGAEMAVRRAQILDSQHLLSNFLRAKVKLEQQDISAARAAIERASLARLAQNPAIAAAIIRQANGLLAVERSVFPEPSLATLNLLGQLHYNLRRIDEAEQYFQRVTAIDANHADSLFHLGLIAGARGERDAAKEFLVRAYGANPRHYGVLTMLPQFLGDGF